MSTQTKNNGTTIPIIGKKVETTVPVVIPKKDESKIAVMQKNPLDEKISFIDSLVKLKSKLARLTESNHKLNDFKLSKGEENIRLTLEDSVNRKVEDFTTSNPEVVELVLQFLTKTIEERKAIVERELIAA